MKSDYIILIVFTIVLAAGAYWYFSSSSGNQAPLTQTSVTDNAAQDRFQSLVGQMKNISFSTAIFSDPRFTSLTSLSTSITPEPSGRLDPFAPVSGVAGR